MTDSGNELPALRRRRLFGLDFVDDVSPDRVVEVLRSLEGSAPADGQLPLVVTPNVDQLVKLERSENSLARSIVQRAAIVLPDGQPIVWASRLLDAPLRSRLAGSSLVAALWPTIVADRRPVLLVLSSDHLAALVRDDAPWASALVPPMLDSVADAVLADFVDRCWEASRASRPEFVFLGIGFPQHCPLIGALVERWNLEGEPLPEFLAIGASFEMYYGLRRRAPTWMQRMGLEWFVRFVQEPRRLFRRYFIDDARFLPLFLREWKAVRRARRAATAHDAVDAS